MTLAGFWRRQLHVGGSIEALFNACPELRGNRFLPQDRPPRRFQLLRFLVPPALPVLGIADSLGIRLPWRLYREVVTCGFYLGKRRWEASR